MKKIIAGRQVEWDEKKDKLNRKKHRISFDTAALVFADPHHREYPDETHSDDEERYIALGLVQNLLFVVFMEREESTRIISARKATAKEGRLYNGNRS